MTQSDALAILKTGANVFLTGEPGAGKTYTLNRYLDYLARAKVKGVAMTASTGIAATHIGGQTIHAWSGMHARDMLTERDIDAIAQKEKFVKRIQSTSVLVLDEISMLSASAFDSLERLCRHIRANGDAFGGMQVIVVGDFFQLPPITPFGSTPEFAFQSAAWGRARFLTCYLDEQHRSEDQLLLSLLSSIRRGEIEEDHYALLAEQTDCAFTTIEPTRLFTHNRDVDALNIERLRALGGRSRQYTMRSTGNKTIVETMQKQCLSPEVLELREDAQVMCTKNNFDAGYVNGTRGRVVGFSAEGFPIIEKGDGTKLTIEPVSWQFIEEGMVRAEITQIPLRLAWAITVHKSQGMSLDAAEIDLRNAFTYGQGYVALSRVRTLAGMKILGVNATALMVDPRVIATDKRFRADAREAARVFADMDEEEYEHLASDFLHAIGGIPPKSVEADGEEEDVPVRPAVPRSPTGETQYITLQHLRDGLSVHAIAKARSLVPTTVWSHIEQLLDRDELALTDVLQHFPKALPWEEVYPRLCEAFTLHGTEVLRPVYEALDEAIPYEMLRIGRVLYAREKNK